VANRFVKIPAKAGFSCLPAGIPIDEFPTPQNQSMPDGRVPSSGGWNRIQCEIDDLESFVSKLKKANARFRNEIVKGIGGNQILLEDPAGNLIEPFEPKKQ
jgi:hypothetical protein